MCDVKWAAQEQHLIQQSFQINDGSASDEGADIL